MSPWFSIFVTCSRLNREYDIQLEDIIIPSDEAALKRGQHLVQAVSYCGGCHGPDYGGTLFLEDPMIGTVYSSNLTSGQGGIGDSYSEDNWVQAIRHGVRPDGEPMVIIPSHHFYRYNDEDPRAIVAYKQSLPLVDHQSAGRQLTLMANILAL